MPSTRGLRRAAAPAGTGGVPPGTSVTAAVEETLTSWLAGRMAESRSLDRVFADEMAEAVASFVLRGGKRLRACFAWWGWRAAGGPATGERAGAALRTAAALELLQALALMHDDVMDGSALRRGAAAVHVDFAERHRTSGMAGPSDAYGRSGAVLAGDLALVWAEDLLADAGLDPAAQCRVRPLWRAMRTEMVAGQYLDLHTQALGEFDPETALRIAALKSAAYTVQRPLGLGAALAGADLRTRRRLDRAARGAGLAFQLRDDLDGVFGDPSRTGKPAGDDVRAGKVTYLAAVARRLAARAADGEALHVLDRCLGDARLSADGLRDFRRAVTAVGGRAAVEARIDALVADSLTALDRAEVAPEAHHRLARLIRRAARVPEPGTVPPDGTETGR